MSAKVFTLIENEISRIKLNNKEGVKYFEFTIILTSQFAHNQYY